MRERETQKIDREKEGERGTERTREIERESERERERGGEREKGGRETQSEKAREGAREHGSQGGRGRQYQPQAIKSALPDPRSEVEIKDGLSDALRIYGAGFY